MAALADRRAVSEAEYLKWRSALILSSAPTPLPASTAPAPSERIPLLTNIIASLKENYTLARSQIARAGRPGGARPFSRRDLWDDDGGGAGAGTGAGTLSEQLSNREPGAGQSEVDATSREEAEAVMFQNIKAAAVQGVDYRWRPSQSAEEQRRQARAQARLEEEKLDEEMLARLLGDLDRDVATDVKHFEAALARAQAEREEEERQAREKEKERSSRANYSST